MIWRSMLPAYSGRSERKKAARRICYIAQGKRRSDGSGTGNNDGGKMKSSDSIR
jgi:hypothetical protein